ncbi:MAG: GAF domain-containing sensor histidine kinase [Gemmatimonadaceae bacterium]|nr:GAF domain-containing sensor histidine kinase [Gemmatimonadaceae bacterium]
MTDEWVMLDALSIGVLVVSRGMVVIRANIRWAERSGAAPVAGVDIASLFEGCDGTAVAAVADTLHDGIGRTFDGCTSGETDASRYTVHRAPFGALIEWSDDRAAMMHADTVTRRLAEVSDMAEVLTTLCEIASNECDSAGGAVLRVVGGRGESGEVVAACGVGLPALGRSFPLEGSMLAEALAQDATLSEANFRQSGRPLMREVPSLDLGPVLVAPLRAHGDALGVLAVMRGPHGRPFGASERARLGVLAEYAALAVHKSLLLQQAQSADKAKGRFLTTMSHELRTPLTALAGYNELLADQVMGPLSEPQLDILERMRSVTMHLSSMIEEILAFTSLEEGREVVRPTEFLAEDLVRAAVAVVEPLAQQKSLAMNVRLPPRSIRMLGDVDKARQILVNLLGNAVKFTDTGSVTVHLSERGDAVCMEISDTGIGIADDELTRLFRPFAQVDTGLTRRHGGTGLGLYISRRLATLLGGHIEVASVLGTGSSFRAVLPVGWEKSAAR